MGCLVVVCRRWWCCLCWWSIGWFGRLVWEFVLVCMLFAGYAVWFIKIAYCCLLLFIVALNVADWVFVLCLNSGCLVLALVGCWFDGFRVLCWLCLV